MEGKVVRVGDYPAELLDKMKSESGGIPFHVLVNRAIEYGYKNQKQVYGREMSKPKENGLDWRGKK